MPTFDYIAVNASGDESRGRIVADNTRAATADLRTRQLFVTEIKAGAASADGASSTDGAKAFDLSEYLSVKGQDVVFFFRQLSFMLRAGLPVVQALQLSRSQTSSGRLKIVISKMLSDIEAGSPMSQAMKKHPQVFTSLMVNLVHAGENTGDMDGIMDRIATHVEKSLALKAMIINAMIYPVVVMLAAIGVAVFLVWKIIPQFEKFLSGKGKALPPSTQMLIDSSHFLRDNGLIIIGIVIAVIIGIALTYKTHAGRLKLDAFVLKVPVFGKLLTSGAMAQLNWSMATMLRSGLTVRDGLLITAGVVTNLVVSEKLKLSAEMILAGRDLSSSVKHPAIPDLVIQMIAVGERTGTLDHVMHELGVFYEAMMQNGIKRLSTMIEPAMILIIGSMVGFVYYSFFQAMFKLAGR
jgi:type IV pilus assembly protein PilC